MADSVYWIWFQLVFGVGTRSAEIMMKFFGDPKSIANGIGSDRRITSMLEEGELERARGAMEQAKRIEERTLKKGCDIITPENPLYPESLLEIYSKPAALYVKGDLSCLKDRLAIALVGSRHPTKYGLDAGRHIASGLAAQGAVIISGLANGIDSACHEAAVEAGSQTIGILGCGIDVDYPKGSSELKRKISENGAVVAEYPLGEPPAAFHFPVRNRIISGLAMGTVVVEAGESSGSLVTADLAVEQGRDVFAVPGSIFSETSFGSNRLIKDGCKPVTCPMDVLEEYPSYVNLSFSDARVHKLPHTPANNSIGQKPVAEVSAVSITPPAPEAAEENLEKKRAHDTLSPSAAAVYEKMTDKPKSADEIISELDMSVGAVLSSLTELEISGLIQIYPGRLFGFIQ